MANQSSADSARIWDVYAEQWRRVDPSVVALIDNLIEIWAHLGVAECFEQVDAHLESEGINDYASFDYMRERVDELFSPRR